MVHVTLEVFWVFQSTARDTKLSTLSPSFTYSSLPHPPRPLSLSTESSFVKDSLSCTAKPKETHSFTLGLLKEPGRGDGEGEEGPLP